MLYYDLNLFKKVNDLNGKDFWILRNSWGEDGYVRMIRNMDNKCLISSVAFVAVDLVIEKVGSFCLKKL